jgi:hypothetical protein
MANFGSLILTTQGLALQEKAEAGKAILTFTRVGIGDKALSSGTDASNLTKLGEEKLSVDISSITVNSNLATLKFVFSNSGLTTGFYIRELGVFANDPDVGEILYAYANAGDDPDYLPAEGSNVVEEIFEVVTAIGTATNVIATIDASLTYLPLTGGNMEGAINESQVTMVSAATMGIGAAAGNFIIVTGATAITSFGAVQAGTRRILKFANSTTITYNATSMILPYSVNLNINAGDVAEFVSLGGGNWVCTNYQPVDWLGETYIPVTASTQSNLTSTLSLTTTHTYVAINTATGLPAQTYKLRDLLQGLVNLSHSHNSTSSTVTNCDCNCNCNCNGNCGNGCGGG